MDLSLKIAPKELHKETLQSMMKKLICFLNQDIQHSEHQCLLINKVYQHACVLVVLHRHHNDCTDTPRRRTTANRFDRSLHSHRGGSVCRNILRDAGTRSL